MPGWRPAPTSSRIAVPSSSTTASSSSRESSRPRQGGAARSAQDRGRPFGRATPPGARRARRAGPSRRGSARSRRSRAGAGRCGWSRPGHGAPSGASPPVRRGHRVLQSTERRRLTDARIQGELRRLGGAKNAMPQPRRTAERSEAIKQLTGDVPPLDEPGCQRAPGGLELVAGRVDLGQDGLRVQPAQVRSRSATAHGRIRSASTSGWCWTPHTVGANRAACTSTPSAWPARRCRRAPR